MYEKPFTLEVVAPDRIVFSGQVTSFSAPGVEGGFQVLFDHAPFLTALTVGEIKIKAPEGTDTHYAVSGGFVEVRNNKVVALVETAEQAGDIDVKRAQAARDRAEERLHSIVTEFNRERARASLERALNRLRIAAKT
jgi:F-type H+-transporting ATPase subunit epsilon